MTDTQPVPARFAPMTESYIRTARELLTTEGKLAPIAFIGNSERDTTTHFLLQSAPDKDAAATAIARIAAVTEADFIFIVMECWMLDSRHGRDYDAIMARYGSIADSPYAIEAVSFSLETHVGTWNGIARQQPVGLSRKKKTFGAVEMKMIEQVQGRFSALLPRQRGATSH